MKKIICNHIQDRFYDLIDHQLSPTEQAEVENHLSVCADCQAELLATQEFLQQIQKVNPPKPSPEVRTRFYAMLDTFKYEEEVRQANSWETLWQKLKASFTYKPAYNWAYSLVILGVGVLGGYFLGKPNNEEINYQNQVAALSTQMQEMRQVMMLSMLENPSASERIKAVSYTDEMPMVDKEIIEALLITLNNDANDNVRIMTLEALAKLADQPMVREGLVASIIKQESPLMQSAMADVMVNLQEKRSVKYFNKLLKRKDIDHNVKSKIELSVQQII